MRLGEEAVLFEKRTKNFRLVVAAGCFAPAHGMMDVFCFFFPKKKPFSES
jgi:hypothetical protein